jgi:leucyl aminopeptidase (aminopeptidase T)
MVMMERFGSPPTLMVRLLSAWDVPFRNVVAGDKFLILTDDAMDPQVWQSAMAALRGKGAEVSLSMHPRLKYHNADPPRATIEAAKSADVVVALTTTALNSGTPGLREVRAAGGSFNKPAIWLMEELTTEILLEGGGRATLEEIRQTCDLQARMAKVYDTGTRIQVKSEFGSDLTAEIGGYEEGYHVKRRGRMPFERGADGVYGRGTWPFGEVHVEPVPGTASGRIVWDTTGHFPPGRWQTPVALEIRDGWVVDISGGAEADQVKWYLDKYGDENSLAVGGEIALGTNQSCWPAMGMMRNDKKRYGAMHFGIGHGSDRGITKSMLRLEGIIARATVIVDDSVVCENGKILV